MITFSCNVPQIALTFGKYPTAGPIRLLTFFPEKERNGREGAARAYNVLERTCFPAQTPGAETLSLSSQRPRGTGCPIGIYLGTVRRGGGRGVPKTETKFQTTQQVFTDDPLGVSPSDPGPGDSCLLSAERLLSARICFKHVTYMTSFGIGKPYEVGTAIVLFK